jgi:hypothetical protein
MMAHMMGRTLVLPDHLCVQIDHLRGPLSVNDFHDYGGMASWVPIVTMQQYLDSRGLPADDPVRADSEALRSYLNDPNRHTVRLRRPQRGHLHWQPWVGMQMYGKGCPVYTLC